MHKADREGIARRERGADSGIVASSLARFGSSAILAVLVLAGAGSSRPAAAASQTASGGAVTPLCSLYVVTISTEILIADFNSPKLSYNAKKWPLLMAQAKNARSAFSRAPLLVVRDRYDSLVGHLRVVGRKLIAGNRHAAYAELKAGSADLKAVTAIAEHAHLACRAGGVTAYIR